MVRLSNLADYAVVVMCQAAMSADTRLSAAAVSAATAIPTPTVAKLMGKMSRAGLLVSFRGVGGGFALARPASEISVAEVVEAVDGPIALTHCTEPANSACYSRDAICSLKPQWNVINRTVREVLAGVSLADLARASLPVAAAMGLDETVRQ